MSIHKEQPDPIPDLRVNSEPPLSTSERPSRGSAIKSKLGQYKRKATTKEGWFGDYDYGYLCMPYIPFMKQKKRLPPFYGLHDELPLLLAIANGLQHCLAMLAGLITPPIIFASSLRLDAETSAYMISASLIGCGAFSLCT